MPYSFCIPLPDGSAERGVADARQMLAICIVARNMGEAAPTITDTATGAPVSEDELRAIVGDLG